MSIENDSGRDCGLNRRRMRRTLYQDLDSLSLDLKNEAKVKMTSLPNPPICGGEYKP